MKKVLTCMTNFRFVFFTVVFSGMILMMSGCGKTGTSSKTVEETAEMIESQSTQDLYERGLHYVKGEGVPRDMEKGAQLIREAAELGHAKSQHLLGTICLVEGNEEEAIQWLRMAVYQKYLPAISMLGGYLVGKRGYEAEGLVLLSRAAEQGDKDAESLLKQYEEMERQKALFGY
ncbi:MAG: hypothetical protein LBQ54_08620 [Planctomycetaceae bacterium]|jgi:TPR repeat protein|nr:hypothetical protein [Planctomycetaceae bacterium]